MPTWRVPVRLTWTGSGSPGVNVFHIRDADLGVPIDDVQPVVDAIHDFYNALNGDTNTLSSIFAGGTTIDLDPLVNVADQSTVTPDWTTLTSGATADDLPPANQFCVSWRTSIAARRGMGRTFLGPLKATNVDPDGTPTDAAMGIVRGAAAALVSASQGFNNGAVGVYGLQDPWDGWPTPPPDDVPRVLRDFTASSVTAKFAVLTSRRD